MPLSDKLHRNEDIVTSVVTAWREPVVRAITATILLSQIAQGN
jgi:hypothetical protein